ncbi:hypothetical protein [Haloarchaeobius amylolyticus]|uniref:hypothetical protein n=1 Tax=Haloarchaeobius amylolyticus TaxID=1198296 RepID=UPI0022702A9C|nr:hypothetical protein [Haloarchaeobius amylolyticus]
MLGLRYFACAGCETVFALPEAESRCPRCDAAGLEEITDRLDGDVYFTRSTAPGTR